MYICYKFFLKSSAKPKILFCWPAELASISINPAGNPPRVSWKIQSFKNEYFHPLNPHHYGSDESRKNFSVLPCLFHPDLATDFCKGAYKGKIIKNTFLQILGAFLAFLKFWTYEWIVESNRVLTIPILP